MIIQAKLFSKNSESTEIELDDSMTVDELRETIAVITDIPADNQKLHIHTLIVNPWQYANGDETTLRTFNLTDRIKIFVVHVNVSLKEAQKMLAKPESKAGKQPKSLSMNNFLNQQMQQFFLDSVADSPEQILDKLKSSPYGKKISKSPQFMKVLENPEMIKDVLRSMMDPEVRNDTMRNLELRMHHISNMGGESMIRNVFEDFLNESDDHSECSPESDSEPVHVIDECKTFDHRQDVEPLPNPWEGKGESKFTPSDFLSLPTSTLMNRPNQAHSHVEKKEQIPSIPAISFNTQQQFSRQLQELHAMGFHNDSENIAALQRSRGDVNGAVLILLSFKGSV